MSELGFVHVDNVTIRGDGSPNDPLIAVNPAILPSNEQAFRVPFLVTAADDVNLLSLPPISLPIPYPDTLYTIEVTVELSVPDVPVWLPLQAYNAGDLIFDSVTHTLQVVTVAGVSGAVAPGFNPQSLGATPDGVGTLVWGNAEGLCILAYVQEKTATGFRLSYFVEYGIVFPGVTLTIGVPMIAHVNVIHD
jgi:hypothetical protein